jgi:hypothetical protein
MNKRMRAAALFMALGVTAVIAQSAPDFTTTEENGRLTITKYNGWDTKLVIPAAIGGKPVTAIGDEAFRKMDLTSVVIPDSVRTIGNHAFSGNNLTSVTIGKGVVSIGAYAFISNDLTSVTIPEGVISIGKLSFRFNKLKSVVVPASVEVLGNWVFSNNPLTDFTLGRDSNFFWFEGFLDNDRWSALPFRQTLVLLMLKRLAKKSSMTICAMAGKPQPTPPTGIGRGKRISKKRKVSALSRRLMGWRLPRIPERRTALSYRNR